MWKSASSQLNNFITPATIYFYVSTDWNGLKTKLVEYYSKDISFAKTLKFLDKKDNEFIISSCEFLENLSIEFDEDEWQRYIKPIFKQENQKERSLPEGWTHRIFEKFYLEYNFPCPYAFKKGYSKKDGSIVLQGYCRECKNELTAVHSATSEKLDFDISIYDSRNIRHFKKRYLSGYLREKKQQILIHSKPLKVQRLESKTFTKVGTSNGPLVHSTPVLRKARISGIFKKQNLKPAKDVIKEVLKMKRDERWSKIIKMVGELPVNIPFWTDEQLDLFLLIISLYLDISFSMDAGGRFINRVKINCELSAHIFLYVVSVSLRGKIYPVFQFATDFHATTNIKHNLGLWTSKGALPMKQVVTDGSKALQNALTLCYNNCSFDHYLNWCHRIIKENFIEIPTCHVRRDIAHLIKSVIGWLCFAISNIAKDFYVRLVGYISKLKNLPELLEIAKNIFLVCQSPGMNSEKVKDAIKYLLDCIKGEKVDYCPEGCTCDYCSQPTAANNTENPNVKETESREKDETIEIDFESELTTLAEKARDEISDGDENIYYCPDFLKNFIPLCAEYPTWTNIMMSVFKTEIDVPTSGRSEALFCDLRHIDHKTSFFVF